jgi:hypothetical protein
MRPVTRIRGRTLIVRGGAGVGPASIISALANRRRLAIVSSLLALSACASNQIRTHKNPELASCAKANGTFVRPIPVVETTGSSRVARFENAVRWMNGTAIVGMDMPYFGEQVSDSLLFAYHGARLGAPSFDGWFAMPRVAASESTLVLVWGEPADPTPRKLAFVPNRLRTLWSATYTQGAGWSAPEKLLTAPDISWSAGTLLSGKTGRAQLAVPVLPEGAGQPVVVYVARDAESWRQVRVPGTEGALFSTLAEARDGTIVLAFVATDASRSLDENSLFITTSSNAGASWSTPRLITRGGVRDPIILFGPDDRLHMLWRQILMREDGDDVIRHVATKTLSRDLVLSDSADLRARPGFFRFTSVIDRCGTIHVAYEDWHGGGDVGDVDYASFRHGVWSDPVHILPGWLSVDPFLMIGDRGEVSLFLLGHQGTAPKARLLNYRLVLE